MQPLRPDSERPADAALRLWLEAVQTLCGLAGQQLAAIDADDPRLVDLLAAKESAYVEADALARQATTPHVRSGPGSESLTVAIQAELETLAELEARSEATLGERLNSVREELESIRRGHTAAFSYAPPAATTPRFLDQRR